MRILPADVYDTLDLTAFVYGGIGAKAYSRAFQPSCALMQCMEAEGGMFGEMWKSLNNVGVFGDHNDAAVRAINRRKGRSRNARVTFTEWCEELGIVRGES
jgi:hypothetical protein